MGVEALLCLLWTVARNTLHAVGYGFGAVKPADSELRVDLADPAPQSTIQVTGSTAVCSRRRWQCRPASASASGSGSGSIEIASIDTRF